MLRDAVVCWALSWRPAFSFFFAFFLAASAGAGFFEWPSSSSLVASPLRPLGPMAPMLAPNAAVVVWVAPQPQVSQATSAVTALARQGVASSQPLSL